VAAVFIHSHNRSSVHGQPGRHKIGRRLNQLQLGRSRHSVGGSRGASGGGAREHGLERADDVLAGARSTCVGATLTLAPHPRNHERGKEIAGAGEVAANARHIHLEALDALDDASDGVTMLPAANEKNVRVAHSNGRALDNDERRATPMQVVDAAESGGKISDANIGEMLGLGLIWKTEIGTRDESIAENGDIFGGDIELALVAHDRIANKNERRIDRLERGVNGDNLLETRRTAHVAGEQMRVAVQQTALSETAENSCKLFARHHFTTPYGIAGVIRQVDAVHGVHVKAVQLQCKNGAFVAHIAMNDP
jgi:hypothetical protein